jgi:hypothetical protein
MSKVVDVSQVQAIWQIFRVLGRLENCSVLRTVVTSAGVQPVSDSPSR